MSGEENIYGRLRRFTLKTEKHAVLCISNGFCKGATVCITNDASCKFEWDSCRGNPMSSSEIVSCKLGSVTQSVFGGHGI